MKLLMNNKVAKSITQYQPDQALKAIQDHLSVIFSDIERIRAEKSECLVKNTIEHIH